ncbi:MAG: UbiA family prenyltransferase, partial [Gemmatimonadota bacterium]
MSRAAALYELTKPGITRLVVLTAAIGYYVAARATTAAPGTFDLAALLNTLLGVGLAASGTNALNQYIEREVDARMPRT